MSIFSGKRASDKKCPIFPPRKSIGSLPSIQKKENVFQRLSITLMGQGGGGGSGGSVMVIFWVNVLRGRLPPQMLTEAKVMKRIYYFNIAEEPVLWGTRNSFTVGVFYYS